MKKVKMDEGTLFLFSLDKMFAVTILRVILRFTCVQMKKKNYKKKILHKYSCNMLQTGTSIPMH